MAALTLRQQPSLQAEVMEALTGESRLGKPGTYKEVSSAYLPYPHAVGLAGAFVRMDVKVPYNWGPFGGYQGRVYDHSRVEAAKAEIGWARAGADLAEDWPTGAFFLRKFFAEGINGGNGVGSPYSCLAKIPVGRWAPGTLVRRMSKIRAKARILMATSVTIKDPSWASVAVAAAGPLPLNKAAVTAWAMTLASPRLEGDTVDNLRHYRPAREWFAGHLCSAPQKTASFGEWVRGETTQGCVVEKVDGVQAIAHPMTTVRTGVTLQRTVELPVSRGGRPAPRVHGLLIRIGTFAYHADYWSGKNEKQAIKSAFEALRQHRDAMRKSAEGLPATVRHAFLAGEVEILVTREDSYEAGNCRQGTESFIYSQGWHGRGYFPASALLASGNYRAVAAAKVALQRFALPAEVKQALPSHKEEEDDIEFDIDDIDFDS